MVNIQKSKNSFEYENFLNWKIIIIGLIAGIISGLFSAGGGMILVPAFAHIFKIGEAKSRATTIFAILPMVITSGLFYYTNNYINWNIGIKCAIGRNCRRIYRSKVIKKIIR